MLRVPSTTVGRYSLEMNDDGSLSHYEGAVWPGAAPEGRAPWRVVVESDGRKLAYSITRQGEDPLNGVLDLDPWALPFIDRVHWPFELMLMRTWGSGEPAATPQLFTGDQRLSLELERMGGMSMSVTHPIRGTTVATVDEQGRIVELTAAGTTGGLQVTRVPWLDIDAYAADFAARDEAGNGLGALSGRGEAVAVVQGATVRVDYGRPSKRGRDIWGGLVPFGEVWRTGANVATHLETDQDLILGGALEVPAGTYTLYTIPEADGGMLIVSESTGQAGTDYAESEDLGRVPLQRTELDETVEVFTITVDETAEGGVLRLRWDRTELSVPFVAAGGEG